MTTLDERQSILEDELLIVRNSGEIPEIALHSTLYYLTVDNEGPRFHLTELEKESLYNAAEERYREIVLRDLELANRDLRIYRGVARTIANWHRYLSFCGRIGRDCMQFKSTVAEKLILFLNREYEEVRSGVRESSINCDSEQLMGFMGALGIDPQSFPQGWQVICPELR
ncbi:MAG: hypothetical protein OEM02_11455 [Desulfobulbaceae bacterium]|nr:hypothetical protein [Desulfobulbaceae bacterium]